MRRVYMYKKYSFSDSKEYSKTPPWLSIAKNPHSCEWGFGLIYQGFTPHFCTVPSAPIVS